MCYVYLNDTCGHGETGECCNFAHLKIYRNNKQGKQQKKMQNMEANHLA